MTDLGDIVDVENLDRMVAEGYIAAKPGPGMTIYDYTQKAQWGRVWNTETLTCRGLTVRDDGAVQARPFGKFFNLSEHANPDLPDLPVEPFEVFEKLDGSLIVASAHPNGGTLLTTRGSFASDQARSAAALWADRFADVEIPQTWCFEYLAPWNRIVVDYGEREDLILLARLDNATGRDLPLNVYWPGATVTKFDGLDDFDTITDRLAQLGPNEEGFVLRFAGGLRAKAKGAEYVRLHRLLTGVSAKTIWECLSNGTGLDEILDRVPDEFYSWVIATASGLIYHFTEIEVATRRRDDIAGLPSRKDQALAVADFPHRAVVFKLLDGKPYAPVIWKAIRPDAERPYRPDVP